MMSPGLDIGTGENTVLGVRGREREEYNLTQALSELQVFIFYPSDWEDDSLSLLSSFSSLHQQFLATQCFLYGCSTDSISSHLNWIKTEFRSGLPFPLLSDMTGQLADRFSLYDNGERINMRGVVITDSKGKEMEVINSSLESEELAKYALNIVRQASQTQAEALRVRGKERVGVAENKMAANKERLASCNNSRSGFRSLDHIWSQVVDKGEAPVVESKRPKPARIWCHAAAQGKDQDTKSVKIWTPLIAKPDVQEQNQSPKPRAKPAKTWGAPPSASCPACGRAVYPVDQVFAADRSKFHKTCIECQAKGCQSKLTARGMHRVGGLRMCARCYADLDRDEKVVLPLTKVETAEETKEREAKDMKEKKMNQDAMMELKAVIAGGVRPGLSR